MRIYIIGNDGITLCREAPPTRARAASWRLRDARAFGPSGHPSGSGMGIGCAGVSPRRFQRRNELDYASKSGMRAAIATTIAIAAADFWDARR
jgi:hypothetical protein